MLVLNNNLKTILSPQPMNAACGFWHHSANPVGVEYETQ